MIYAIVCCCICFHLSRTYLYRISFAIYVFRYDILWAPAGLLGGRRWEQQVENKF